MINPEMVIVSGFFMRATQRYSPFCLNVYQRSLSGLNAFLNLIRLMRIKSIFENTFATKNTISLD